MIINSGDPRGHMGFVHQEEEEPVTGEEYCDSDSDDDDVDRYVFLARQPAPAEARDDDDAMPGGGGGGRGRKRRLREILGVASPSAKKARLDPTAPLAPAGTSGSGTTASSPCGALAGDSGSVDAVAARFPEREGVDRKAKNKKRGRCGGDQCAARSKRSKGADCDAGEVSHRDVMAAEAQETPAAAAAAAAARASRRFLCSICGKCFGSHQALGGHVLGHRKKAKSNIAAASREEYAAGGNGYCSEKTASREEGADGTGGHGEEKAVVAASLGKANGEGNYDGNKTMGVAACHEDVDGSGHGHDKAEKTSAVAASHHQHGNGSKGEDDAIAAIHYRANGDGHNEEIKAIGAANHDDHNGDGDVEEEVAVAPRHRNANANGTVNKVVAVGRCRNKLTAGNGNGNSIVRKTQHRCEVCGKECPTGQALGGHMRKHRTRPAHGGEGGSAMPAPEADGDTQPPPARLIGAEICLE